jgi:hypothetical protein
MCLMHAYVRMYMFLVIFIFSNVGGLLGWYSGKLQQWVAILIQHLEIVLYWPICFEECGLKDPKIALSNGEKVHD